jgi:hypothetical protein
MSLEHARETIEEFHEENAKAPVITARGQVWRGGGAPVMEIRKYETTSVTQAFHVTR